MQPEKGEVNSILTCALKAESNSSDGKEEKSFLHTRSAYSLWISTCKIMTHLNAEVTKIFLKHAKVF